MTVNGWPGKYFVNPPDCIINHVDASPGHFCLSRFTGERGSHKLYKYVPESETVIRLDTREEFPSLDDAIKAFEGLRLAAFGAPFLWPFAESTMSHSSPPRSPDSSDDVPEREPL